MMVKFLKNQIDKQLAKEHKNSNFLTLEIINTVKIKIIVIIKTCSINILEVC